MIEKMPHTIGIGYSIGQKYQPIWVSVSVSDLNQNSGFGRTLLVVEYMELAGLTGDS